MHFSSLIAAIAAVLTALPMVLSADPAAAGECDDQGLCPISRDGAQLGTYRIRGPNLRGPLISGARPAVIFIHGWRSSSRNVIRIDALRRFADQIGAMLIAPQGIETTWSYPGSPLQARDEFAYFDALREDVIARHNVDPNRILVSGFSMGASMAWNLACRRGEDYWGFVTFSGAFWEPAPARCAAPARRLIHFHGDADTMVPIEGRPIGRGFRQSDVGESFKVLIDSSPIRGAREQLLRLAATDCRRWGGDGRLMMFCRHKGGHLWRAVWLKAAYEALKER